MFISTLLCMRGASGAGRGMLEQLGTALPRPVQRHLRPPLAEQLVVARHQHVRNSLALELGRTSVLGMLKKPFRERVAARRLLIAQHPPDMAGDHLHQDHGGQLTTTEDVVADADLVIGQPRPHALVKTLIPPRDQDQAGLLRERGGQRLVELATLGREQDAGRLRSTANLADGLEYGLWLQHHARATPVGDVVDLAVLVTGEGAEVVRLEHECAALDGPTDNTGTQWTGEEVGEQGDDVEPHFTTSSSGRSTTIRPALRSTELTTCDSAGTSTSSVPSETT